MKKLLIISKNKHASPTRLRGFAFESLWNQAGWTIDHACTENGWLNRIKILFKAKEYNAIVIIRKLLPSWYLRQLRKHSKALLFDFDDAVFSGQSEHFSAKRYHRFCHTMKHVHAVLAGNHYLENAAKKAGAKHVFYIPNAVSKDQYNVSVKKTESFIECVWIGSLGTKPYLESVIPILEQAVNTMPKLRLKVISDFELHSKTLPIINIPWSAEKEAIELKKAHIGIAPSIDNKWTRGKCGMKVIQYLACGLPVIASNCGVHLEQIQHNKTGFLASTQQEWLHSLHLLYNEPILRDTIGKNAYDDFLKHYELSVVFEQRKHIIEEILL